MRSEHRLPTSRRSPAALPLAPRLLRIFFAWGSAANVALGY